MTRYRQNVVLRVLSLKPLIFLMIVTWSLNVGPYLGKPSVPLVYPKTQGTTLRDHVTSLRSKHLHIISCHELTMALHMSEQNGFEANRKSGDN